MSSTGPSKLGTALIVVFVCSLLALVAELVYVLWRRRVFRQRIAAGDGGNQPDFSGDSISTSKELLLYFLCWKYQFRVEPDGGRDDPEEEIDVLKLQGMRGPSRVLFTIREEEREGAAESDKSLSLSPSSAEKVLPHRGNNGGVSLEECFRDAGDSPEVTVTIEPEPETTPFSTPCDSPLYYTPTASPSRESDSVTLSTVASFE